MAEGRKHMRWLGARALRGGWLLALVVLAGLLGCERRDAASVALAKLQAEEEPEQVSWGARFSVFNDDRPRADIVAGYMEQYETEDSTYTLLHSAPDGGSPERVTAHLFNEEGDSSAVITADRLIYYPEEDRFEARGHVVVETTDDKRLEGEHLAWYETERKVRTPGFVRITTPTDRVRGYGLVANEDLSNYQLANVTGETTVEE